MRRLFVCLAIALLTSAGARAQETVGRNTFESTLPPQVATTILTIDLERLFEGTEFGQRVISNYTAESLELAAEHRRIAEALREEAQGLAVRRPDMDPALFRAEAEAFDAKAQEIRRAQDAKRAAIEEALSAARAQFLEVTRPILGRLMVERGASVILDRRTVLLSLGNNDITEDAIVRINEVLGDGTAPEALSQEENSSEETPTEASAPSDEVAPAQAPTETEN